MKLYPLLFLDEAAKSVQEALQENLALFVDKNEEGLQAVLIKIPEVEAGLQEMVKTIQANPDAYKNQNVALHQLAGILVHAVKGNVGAYLHMDPEMGLYEVFGSSAQDKFGPLTYEIIMGLIYPYYLRSDASITKHAVQVWDKMYERADVSKIWLGNLSAEELEKGFKAIGLRIPASEASTFSNITEEEYKSEFYPDVNPHIGPLYAYRLKPNSETNRAYRSLHENGSALVAKFHKELVKFFPSLKRQDLVEKLFTHAGYLHFRSVYKPEEAISL